MLLSHLPLLALGHFAAGLILGHIFYRSDFCMAGMVRDFFLFGDNSRLRSLLLAVLLTTLFFLLARALWLLPFAVPPTFGLGSVAGIVGGLLFGIGMVLAGGCVVGTLYKLGSGNLTSLVAFAGIVGGSLIYAEIHLLVREMEQLLPMTGEMGLLQSWPRAGGIGGWLLLIVFLPLLRHWQRQGLLRLEAAAEGYLQPWRVAVILALLNLLLILATGWPMGISTAYAKIGAYLAAPLAPAHLANLAYFTEPSLVVTRGETVLSGGAGPRVDLISFSELPLLLGIIIGSLLTALRLREFRFYGLPPLRQGVAALIGGILVALGARIAGGCNFKYLLGGLPLFSYQAMLFTMGMVAGAWLGARLLTRIILR
ncbi:YeeE/YedE thiosulfate transporter family protein [Desulfurivibrio sp. D14AmB]|uniref:YeeE/YedE thiosulfate transporter family protein n=1 Tax=Desulfurivibrio sp. D14AmB TaxID=3374370 RepID=UPI00376EADBD